MNPQANPSQPFGTPPVGPSSPGADGKPDDDEISLLDLFATIAANLKLLIIAPLLVGFAVLGISFLITPTYTAQTKFLPPMQQESAAAAMLQQLGGLAGLAGAAGGITDPADQFVAFLGSRSIQDRLVERFGLMDRYQSPNRELAARALADRTRVSSGRDGLISIQFDDPDPAFAAQVANAYVEELSQLVGRLALTEAQHRRKFFEQHLVKVSADLQAAEQALMATGVNVREINIQPGATLQAVALLRAQVTAQEVQVASMRTHLSEAAPEVRQAMATLGALRGQLNRLDAQERAAPNAAARNNPNNNPGYFARLREFTLQQTLFELMVKQYEIARVDESREGASIQVLDLAQPPEQRSSPKRALMASIAALAAGFALLLFVFVREAVRNAGNDPESSAKITRIRRSLGLSA